MKRLIIYAVCLLLILTQSPVYAVEVKRFISASFIKVNSSDWLNPDYDKGYYLKPNYAATVKAGIVLMEKDLSVDFNLYHLSNPTIGTIGDLKEGDSGVNGFEWGIRYEF